MSSECHSDTGIPYRLDRTGLSAICPYSRSLSKEPMLAKLISKRRDFCRCHIECKPGIVSSIHQPNSDPADKYDLEELLEKLEFAVITAAKL